MTYTQKIILTSSNKDTWTVTILHTMTKKWHRTKHRMVDTDTDRNTKTRTDTDRHRHTDIYKMTHKNDTHNDAHNDTQIYTQIYTH